MRRQNNAIRLLWVLAFGVVCLCLLGACKKPNQKGAGTPVREIEVTLAGKLVLTARNEPGPLRSTALPPSPDWKPPQHPFLTAQAHDAATESRLKDILDQSRDFDDYLRRLSKEGFHVKESTP